MNSGDKKININMIDKPIPVRGLVNLDDFISSQLIDFISSILIFLLFSNIALVIEDGAGPPFVTLYLMPKSSSGPPGL